MHKEAAPVTVSVKGWTLKKRCATTKKVTEVLQKHPDGRITRTNAAGETETLEEGADHAAN